MKAWEDFLLLQEKELGPATVKKWLAPLNVIKFDACNLYLEAKDTFQIHWFEEHIRPTAQIDFVNQNNKKIKIHLSIAKKNQEHLGPLKKQLPESTTAHPTTFQLDWDAIDSHFTFKNYIVTQGNIMPYKLLCELVGYQENSDQLNTPKTSPGTFNPIFLTGPSGVGKTHLLMATASYFQKRGLKVLYTKAETFTEHVVSSIRSSEMQFFRQAYRNIDALFIDDVEIFSRKGATQEELFHTFNTLHLEGKQILLSSKNTPQELTEIEPRLVSRFEWGIVLPLVTLQPENMHQLLVQKLNDYNLTLTDKACDFFLKTFQSSTKSLLKALEALILRSHLESHAEKNLSQLSVENIKHTLFDLIKVEEQSILTPPKIIKTVAEFYGIRVDDILGKSQSRECAFPRQIAMYLCRKELKLAFMKIGDLFSRDHSTVMTSVKHIEKTTLSDLSTTQALSHITKLLKS